MPNPNETEAEKLHDFEHGTSRATADMASDPPQANEEPRSFEQPATRRVTPTEEKPDHMAAREAEAEDRQEALLDEAIEETFPGSDPISPKRIT